jgi:hypothetical protein
MIAASGHKVRRPTGACCNRSPLRASGPTGAEQIAEAKRLLGGEVFFALEHAPARLLQERLVSVGCQLARLGGANLIQGLVHFRDDVEAVQNMQGQGTLLADHLQVGLPHIGADKQNLGSHLLADDGKEALEGFDGAFLANPQQVSESLVDLVTSVRYLWPLAYWISSTPIA